MAQDQPDRKERGCFVPRSAGHFWSETIGGQTLLTGVYEQPLELFQVQPQPG